MNENQLSIDNQIKIARSLSAHCKKRISNFWQRFSAKIRLDSEKSEIILSAWIRECDDGKYSVRDLQFESNNRKLAKKMIKMVNYGLVFNEKGITLSFQD